MDIKVGPELLEALPWATAVAISAMITVIVIVEMILKKIDAIANGLALIIKAWRSK